MIRTWRLPKQAGAVPNNATKESHGNEREQFKVCSLGVQYGMQAEGLAKKLDASPAKARELLLLHRATYPQYWRWSDAIRDSAVLQGKLQAVFGWTVHVPADANPRSLRNFPLQANGGEMLRLACCTATELGIRVCCPVHDALLIEAPLDNIDGVVRHCQQVMEDASRIVLDGFTIRTEAKVVRNPDRYMDKRGASMWAAVSSWSGVSMSEPFSDLERFRLPDQQVQPQPKTILKRGKTPWNSPKVQGEFLKGPIPLDWLGGRPSCQAKQHSP